MYKLAQHISSLCLKAFEELERLLTEKNICVAVKEKLTKDSGVAGEGSFDHIVDKIQAKPKARGESQHPTRVLID